MAAPAAAPNTLDLRLLGPVGRVLARRLIAPISQPAPFTPHLIVPVHGDTPLPCTNLTLPFVSKGAKCVFSRSQQVSYL